MRLTEFVATVENFDAMRPREKIQLLAWHLHTHANCVSFDAGAIRKCFKELFLEPPNVAQYIGRMVESRPREIIKDRGAYQLERTVRSRLDAAYGTHPSIVTVSKILAELPERVPNVSEKAFLLEAISCYKVAAYRACIVMTWNLAFDHLIGWLMADADRIAKFNATIKRRLPKKTVVIVGRDDFEDFKESEVIEVCGTASLMSGNIIDILRQKLKRRNIAAHPSGVIVTQAQTDDAVTDLINNVVLKLL